MMIEIHRETSGILSAYATIPIAFDIREVIDLPALVLQSRSLPTRAVASRLKDYDALPDNDPLSWPRRHPVGEWVFLIARSEGRLVAGAVVITEPREVITLGGRADNALLWDLRVAPDWRRRGVGRALLAAAEDAARDAGTRALDVETQDTNVPACQLYASCGFALIDVQPHGYTFPSDEAKLLWSKTLTLEAR